MMYEKAFYFSAIRFCIWNFNEVYCSMKMFYATRKLYRINSLTVNNVRCTKREGKSESQMVSRKKSLYEFECVCVCVCAVSAIMEKHRLKFRLI